MGQGEGVPSYSLEGVLVSCLERFAIEPFFLQISDTLRTSAVSTMHTKTWLSHAKGAATRERVAAEN